MEKCPKCGAPLPSGVLAGFCPACLFKQGAAADTATQPEAAPFQPPGLEEVARLFPQLEILAFIGKGGMGAVYKARQPALDRLVALKILPPQTAGGPGFVERFNREARALAKLNHPNIVSVFEFGQANGMPFFVMEFVDGLNLRQVERAGTLSPRQALQVVPQICEALQFAHDEGIVHRDIKPENILVDKKGRVKIADFGIAKIVGAEKDVSITETQGAIGTPHYMAPEQMEKPTTVDHRADIFSLGVVFYEMLTGELPLGKFAPPSSRKLEVDVRLDDVVLRALEKDPERRYQQVSQVKTAVDTIASTAAAPPPLDSEGLAREILARDYVVDIGSCLRRAWALLRGDFWPLAGVTALMLALLAAAGSIGGVWSNSPHEVTSSGTSALVLLLYGPLMGGLSLYYLKKIRGEPANIETAFFGFSNRFLHLFLGGFVTWVLAGLGFACLILPGIYLMVAWWFTLTLIADKRLDFWPAMELSRKVVTRHWWKLFGFFLVVLLMYALGALCCLVGFFVTAPLAMIAATYAYEDIFGGKAPAAKQPAAAFGPGGTEVLPNVPSTPPTSRMPWRIIIIWLMVMVFVFVSMAVKDHQKGIQRNRAAAAARAGRIFTIEAELQAAKDKLAQLRTTFTETNPLVQQQDAMVKSLERKLGKVPPTGSAEEGAAVSDARKTLQERLTGRMEAASGIADLSAKGQSLAAVSIDAAKAGEAEIAKYAFQQIADLTLRDQTAQQSAHLLAGRGQTKPAIEIAKSISDPNLRDQVLIELAQ
ncbi:MAG TPA: protein kinase [Candidatus Saccharimonadales bacterium]|nr:protein kinase [Candidatus Saccharimonadales bacterium]